MKQCMAIYYYGSEAKMQRSPMMLRSTTMALATLVVPVGCFGDPPAPLVLPGTEDASSGTVDFPLGDSTSTGASVEPARSRTATATTGADETSSAETTLGGATSTDASENDPSTGSDTTSSENTTAPPAAECGNGVVENGEDCDGIDWQGSTCESLGYAPGSLSCTGECLFDVMGCVPPGMVLVPDGPFMRGSELQPDEQPAMSIDVDMFYIDVFEVTEAQYTQCVEAGQCLPAGLGSECNSAVPGRDEHPINCVDWLRANAYCSWVDGGTKRLPTEAEWEKAARGSDERTYPWGNAPEPTCDRVVMNENDEGAGCQEGSTWPVGSMPLGVSPFGAEDMAGNVWEWVSDWYAPYDPGMTDNPTGPPMGTSRIVRGGGWYHPEPEAFTTTNRHTLEPSFQDQFIGFRCARSSSGAP